MIGVVARRDQTEVVEEFFELFKTPWEFCKSGGTYDVIVATADAIPDAECSLLLLYGPTPTSVDTRSGVTFSGRHRRATLHGSDGPVPIYGEIATFVHGPHHESCLSSSVGTAGVRMADTGTTILRFGYDLFEEVRLLLSDGQPVEQAQIPTLDLHVAMLRNAVLDAGTLLIEIPPRPAGHDFAVCLTHDIDFVSIRHHVFDHTMWGFLHRSTLGSIRDLMKARLPFSRALRMWWAAISLPFVHLGLAKDFWEPFAWYLRVEKGLPATYFLIPFKRRAGERVEGDHASRRATAYDVDDIRESMALLQEHGCELGVHGIDAWHSVDKGRVESDRLAVSTGQSSHGVRMHWLLSDANSARVLEDAGYQYDSTNGYNETIGYRAGTGQVFRPLTARTLLELPMHIQDGALFYAQRLDLSEAQAWEACERLITNAARLGGVLTLLWHDRSHGPERFWGAFYARLVERLKATGAWFGSAQDLVDWFRRRRSVRFVRGYARGSVVIHCDDSTAIEPPLRVQIHQPGRTANKASSAPRPHVMELAWNGKTPLTLDSALLPDAPGASSLMSHT